MKRVVWLFLLLPVLLMPGCSHEPTLQSLAGVTFDRGSGSVWGNQLYISLTETRIVTLRYIPKGTAEQKTLEQLPLAPEQWQEVVRVLEQLPLEKEKRSLLENLFPKQDGGDYRRLTLTYGKTAITYRWPDEGTQLERLLEQLAEEVSG